MKFLIILFLGIVAGTHGLVDSQVAQQLVNHIRDICKQCLVESGASQDDIETYVKHIVPASHEGKCLMFCVHRSINWQDANGDITLDKALKYAEMLVNIDADLHKAIVEIMTTCSNRVVPDADPCITAGLLGTCGMDESHRMGLKSDILEI